MPSTLGKGTPLRCCLKFKPLVLIVTPMKTRNDKIPNPKEIEKELTDFLAKRFGGSVKMVSATALSPEPAPEVEGKTPGAYTMEHTAASFIFDPQGRIRLYVRPGQTAQAMADDIRLLLKGV